MILINSGYGTAPVLEEKDLFKDENFVNWFELFQNSKPIQPIYENINAVEEDSVKTQKAVNSILMVALYDLTYKNKNIYKEKISEKFKNASKKGLSELLDAYASIKEYEGQLIDYVDTAAKASVQGSQDNIRCKSIGNIVETVYLFKDGNAIKTENLLPLQGCLHFARHDNREVDSFVLRYVLKTTDVSDEAANTLDSCIYKNSGKIIDEDSCKNIRLKVLDSNTIGEKELYLMVKDKYTELLNKYSLDDETIKNIIVKNKDVARWINKAKIDGESPIYG
ncbi:MAG: hypothetical protein KAT91_02995 [Candidatus Aenigmarchaeota archaeon]|nr:hypothetical protein [Candidatus Aenigmarchaeota archaeon]